jgi:UPF0755 protein
MRRARFHRPGLLAVSAVLALLVLFMGGIFLYGEFSTSIQSESPLAVEIRRGETLRQVTGRLAEMGVLRRPGWLTTLAILRGDSGHIQAGEYVFQGAVSPNELLDSLVTGRARFSSLTVPEGWSLAEIAQRLEERELGRASELLRLARDPDFIASLALPFPDRPASLEGFLYPETYYFHRGVSEAVIIATLVEEFKKRAAGPLIERAAGVGMTPYQVLTLASIVEKETGVDEERPLISAVFHNRLQSRMRLASDPTVIYGLADFDGNLKRAHLLQPTPYNTYKVGGLPPTPIANPGLTSILAAVAPAPVDYLFFVAKGDGTHYFSNDFRAHKKAVYRFQIRPNRKPNF